MNLVTIQDTEFRQGIKQAIERSKKYSQSVLVSEVQEIERINPFYFFAAGQKNFLGERFFWKDPEGSQILVGMGVEKSIQSEHGTERFESVEKKWKRLKETAIVLGIDDQLATGPILFGGFSFDPLKKKTNLWSKFADSLLHLPTYLLSIVDGRAFFTTNVICTQHDDLSLFDKINKERQALIALAEETGEFPIFTPIRIEEIKPEEWKNSVTKLVESFFNSDLKKVVLARELRLYFNDEVVVESVLSRLLNEQKESFIFAFESNGDCFIGATPERLVKRDGQNVYSTCLAGSIARGQTPQEDKELGQALLNDQKNLIEHQYVVEMIKEAMEQTCDSVYLPERPQLMKTKDIQHLYTPVVGKNRRGTSLLTLVDKLHPTPALGGLPKEKAVEKIREIEDLDRGFYASPIGWLDYQENGEFVVGLRSGLVQGKEATLFAGCGVVADSDAESEYTETSIKFRPMLNALGGDRK